MEENTITIVISEVDNKLSVSCNIPDEMKYTISGALAARTIDFINITMNKLVGEDVKISKHFSN